MTFFTASEAWASSQKTTPAMKSGRSNCRRLLTDCRRRHRIGEPVQTLKRGLLDAHAVKNSPVNGACATAFRSVSRERARASR
jgi:hypothetical protein